MVYRSILFIITNHQNTKWLYIKTIQQMQEWTPTSQQTILMSSADQSRLDHRNTGCHHHTYDHRLLC